MNFTDEDIKELLKLTDNEQLKKIIQLILINKGVNNGTNTKVKFN